MNEIDFSSFLSDEHENTNDELSGAIARLQSEGFSINPMTQEVFEDEGLSNALGEKLSSAEIREFIKNSSLFLDFRASEKALIMLGDNVTIPESIGANGTIRRSETGQRVLISVLESEGIDPAKVLMFRVTQPSDTPKPEYYWTSDYFEVVKGLNAEIDPELRSQSVILVSTIEEIDKDEGLIVDINDDSGMPVRQIGLGSFDQSRCLASIKTHN